jgi:hypothetical protein
VTERESGKVVRDIAISSDELRRGGGHRNRARLRLEFDGDGQSVKVTLHGDAVHVDLERGAVDVRPLNTALEVEDALIESYLSSVDVAR